MHLLRTLAPIVGMAVGLGVYLLVNSADMLAWQQAWPDVSDPKTPHWLFLTGWALSCSLANFLVLRRWPGTPSVLTAIWIPFVLLAAWATLGLTPNLAEQLISDPLRQLTALPHLSGWVVCCIWDLGFWALSVPPLAAPQRRSVLRLGVWGGIGFLAYGFAVPAFWPMQDRCRCVSIKPNMYTAQTMLEAYSIDWGGRYPTRVSDLLAEAEQYTYFKRIANPLLVGKGASWEEASAANKGWVDNQGKRLSAQKLVPGAVYYDLVSESRYYLYGVDEQGQLVRKDKQVFVLTNQ